MTTTTTDVTTITPLAHQEAMRLQAQELERTLTLLRSLDQASWAAATDCPAWDIRAMYQHVLGACEAGASIPENIGQLRRARAYRRQHGGPLEAALSAVQVSDRAGLSPAQVTRRLEAVAPKTVRGRARTPALLRRHARLTVDGPVCEKWTPGYLIDTIYLRDLWMHRIDAARAAGQPPELTAATTAASSLTSPPNGPAATASRSCSTSPARPAAATPATPPARPPNTCPGRRRILPHPGWPRPGSRPAHHHRPVLNSPRGLRVQVLRHATDTGEIAASDAGQVAFQIDAVLTAGRRSGSYRAGPSCWPAISVNAVRASVSE